MTAPRPSGRLSHSQFKTLDKLRDLAVAAKLYHVAGLIQNEIESEMLWLVEPITADLGQRIRVRYNDRGQSKETAGTMMTSKPGWVTLSGGTGRAYNIKLRDVRAWRMDPHQGEGLRLEPTGEFYDDEQKFPRFRPIVARDVDNVAPLRPATDAVKPVAGARPKFLDNGLNAVGKPRAFDRRINPKNP